MPVVVLHGASNGASVSMNESDEIIEALMTRENEFRAGTAGQPLLADNAQDEQQTKWREWVNKK